MNIINRLLPKTIKYGKCIGISKNNGIKVYQKVLNNGTMRKFTSFTSDGKLFKEVVVEKNFYYDNNRWMTKLKEIVNSTAKNFKTGKYTQVQREKILPKGALTEQRIAISTDIEFNKWSGSMDKNFNLDMGAKRINTAITKKKNTLDISKMSYYPDGSSIYYIKSQRGNHYKEYISTENLKMPSGIIVNRAIIKETMKTPTVEYITGSNKNAKNTICQMSNKHRFNLGA